MTVRTLALSLSILSFGIDFNNEAHATEPEGTIDAKADSTLRKMSDYVGGLNSFRVDTTTADEKITDEGQKIQELKDSTISVKRPGQMRIDRAGPQGHVSFFDDGANFTIFHKETKKYATAPAPAKLDAAIDTARDKLAIEAPGGDLLGSDAYNKLIPNIIVGRYIGMEPVEGVMAHHLAMTGKTLDWQIWIKDGADPLPLRYVITSKDLPNHPQFIIAFKNWRPNASIPADNFSFTVPAGAKRVEFASGPAHAPGN